MSNYIKLGIFEYNPADVLGSGAFAIVYKGRFHDKPEEKVAIKQMIKGQNVLKSKTLLSKEIAVLKDLNHDNIVRLYDHSISNTEVYLVMEFCNGGDLSDYLHCKKTLPEDTIRHFLMQIGSSMDAMNKQTIMHRDLKPGNILLKYWGDYKSVNDVPGHAITFKLADFGFARFLHDGIMAETMCGSPMYMAPEVLMCRKYDARADIWSMGVIVYQCYVGKAPFYANSPEALKNIYEKTVDLKPKLPRETSPYLRDLLLKMLIRKPSDRIDFPHFLSHPFLQPKKVSPSDLLPKQPASVPPLPGSVARGVPTVSSTPMRTPYASRPTNRTCTTPALPLRRTSLTKVGETVVSPVSRISSLMPVQGRVDLERVGAPRSTGLRRPQGSQLPIITPTRYERPTRPNVYESDTTASTATTSDDEGEDEEASLTPTDEFIEDGLGGNSFLNDRPGGIERRTDLSTDGYGGLDPCLTDVLKGQQHSATRNRQAQTLLGGHGVTPLGEVSMDRDQLEGYVIVDPNGAEVLPNCVNKLRNFMPTEREQLPDYQLDWTRNTPGDHISSSEGIPSSAFHGVQQPSRRSLVRPKTNEGRWSGDGIKGNQSPQGNWGANTNVAPSDRGYAVQRHDAVLGSGGKPLHQTTSDNSIYYHEDSNAVRQPLNNAMGRRQSLGADYSRMNLAPELFEETLMEPEHTKEMQTVTMVLELCELLTELAERRASALTGATAAPDAEPHTQQASPPDELNNDDQALHPTSTKQQKHPGKNLKLISPAKRVVEQLVLYRRILYYLEYVFAQVKKAVDNERLKPTTIAKRRLTDCNALYHRCYIRLCRLSRQSRRDDLIEPVGRLLSRITANRLIFNYALDQCYAAEMDEYIGELGLCLRRYRAAIILIHGLSQHAKNPSDKTLLSDCLRLIQERHANLWELAAGRAGISPEPGNESSSPLSVGQGYQGQSGITTTGLVGSPR